MCHSRGVAHRDGDGWIECSCGQNHWGLNGAAGLLLIRGGKIMLQHRAPWVHNGDTWGIPGGARDSHENGLEAALRESREEIGIEAQYVTAHFSHLDDHGAHAVWESARLSASHGCTWPESSPSLDFGLHGYCGSADILCAVLSREAPCCAP